jgi:multiple sugar transport system substrate-binding protein
MDKSGNDKTNFGTGFNDSISPTAGSGIDVEKFKVGGVADKSREPSKFNAVVETIEEPKFEEFKPPQVVEIPSGQNKIPTSIPLNISPKKIFTGPKKGLSKVLLIVAAILLTLLVVLFVVSKLGGDKPVNDLGDKGEITWWGITYEESDLSDLIKKFEEENPGIKVNYRKQSTENYRERLTSSLASGKGPDIFEFHNSWPPMFRRELSALPENILSKEEYKKTFYPGIVADLTIDKKIVGIPLEYDSLVLFINQTFFSSATKEPPTTWDEVRELALLFSQRDDRDNLIQAGVPLGITDNVDHWQEILGLMLYQNGADLSNPNSDETTKVADFYSDFYNEAEVWNDSFPASTIAFARGQVAMYIGPSRRAVDVVRIDPTLRFVTVDIPQLAKDNPASPDFSYSTYWSEGVWDRSSDKEEAWKLLTFLSSKESLEKINSNVKKRIGMERPFPRIDMAEILIKDPIVGSVVRLAPYSKSWYLSGFTYDGETGLNTKLANAYRPLLNTEGRLIPNSLIDSTVSEVSSILKSFSIK